MCNQIKKLAGLAALILTSILFSGSAASAGLSIIQQDAGNKVKFEVNITNSPEMLSFGFDIFYDYSTISYESFERGALVKDENKFTLFSVNKLETGSVRIGAVGTIQSGSSGSIAILTFNKLVNQPAYSLAFGNGVDDCPSIPNSAPIVASNQIFNVISPDYIIGRVNAFDDQKDMLHFTIKSGNTDNIFTINSGGDISLTSLRKCGNLPRSYTLEIEVSDGDLSTVENVIVNFCEVCEKGLDLVISALQILSGSKGFECLTSQLDCNNDKKIWLDDVAYLLQIIAGLRIPK